MHLCPVPVGWCFLLSVLEYPDLFQAAVIQVIVWPLLNSFTFLFASRRVVFPGVSSGSRMVWRYHHILLVLIFAIHFSCFALLYRSSLDIFSGHLMFMAFHGILGWYKSKHSGCRSIKIYDHQSLQNTFHKRPTNCS